MLSPSTEQIAWLQQHNIIKDRDSLDQPFQHKNSLAIMEELTTREDNSSGNEITKLINSSRKV